jgi:all-trans-retinol 13,14-reductase
MSLIIRFFLACGLAILCCNCHPFNKKVVDVSEEQHWVVKSDPSTAKAQNEYDVIVVGSGIGGLSCGSLLAKDGYKVLILEQQGQVGGFCTSFSREGFTFPVGAHDISGCDQGMVGRLLETLDLRKEDLFALNTRTYIMGDTTISFTGTKNDVVEKLSELFPAEKQALIEFFQDAEQALSKKNLAERWRAVSYQRKLDEFFQDPQLKQFLCSLLGYLGTKPNETTAEEALYGCLSYFIRGGHYPKGGGKLFAEALKHSIESHGGTVLTNTKVDTILVHNDHVTGVACGNQRFISSLVVANVNAKTLFSCLLPSRAFDSAFLDAISRLKMSESCDVVHLGVDLDLSSLPSITKVIPPSNGIGEQFSFFINSNADPTAAPQGKASVSIDCDDQYADVPPAGTPEYRAYKKKLVQSAIEKLEKVIPGIRGHVVVTDVVTPRTYESFTSMPEGAVYAFDQSKGSKRPYFKTPIQGLYLASASTLPGGGVEAVVVSGFICAKDIMRNKKSVEDLSLPPPSLKSSHSVEETIEKRHSTRCFVASPIPLSEISQLLWAAQGITHGQTLRSAPSAGALYPLEVYLVAENVAGIPAGMYKYNSQKHSLEKLFEGHLAKKLCRAANSQTSVGQAAAIMIICGVYEREAKKYGEKSKEYTDMEVGCVAENVYLQAVSCDIGTVFVAGFDPGSVKEILCTPESEQPLCILPLGKT